MSDKIRAFIAVPLDQQAKSMIEQVQTELKRLDCNIKWVDPALAHLTLKFLGDTEQKKIIEITAILEQALKRIRSIPTVLTQPGAFPRLESPRVIWAGLNDENGQIGELARMVNKALGDIGIKKDQKPFNAHITIGRTRSPRNIRSLSEALADCHFKFDGKLSLDRVVLYKSTLTSDGPIHEAIKEYILSAGC